MIAEQLWKLIEELHKERDRIPVGPDEALVANRLVLELAGQGVSRPDWSFSDYHPYLEPVFAKSREQRTVFARVFDRVVEDSRSVDDAGNTTDDAVAPETPPPKSPWQRIAAWIAERWTRRTLGIAGALLVMLAIGVASSLFLTSAQRVDGPQNTNTPAAAPTDVKTPQGPNTAETKAPQTAPASPPMERLVSSARLHDGAPTLAEIARDLAATAPMPMRDEEYLRRLRDLTGMQPNRPLALYDAARPTTGGGRNEIAWAIGEIEMPGRSPSFAELRSAQSLYDGEEFQGQARSFTLLMENLRAFGFTVPDGISADAALDSLAQRTDQSRAARTATDCRATPNQAATSASAVKMAIGDCQLKTRIATLSASIAQARAALPPSAIARAISIADPNWYPAEAPWLPEPVKRPVTPAWVAFLVALLVLALFAVPLVALIDRKRRAFLTRKPPDVPPHRTRLIREANEMLLGETAHYAEIRKALQRREPVPTAALDVDATVRATLSEGSGRIVPRYAATRSAAEYLVLIDRRCLNDLEAERAWTLIEPLRAGAVGFDVYWFHADPGWCTPEREGAPVRIEELAARFPRHRLLLFGDGVEMIDLFSGRPLGGYAALDRWVRRGMLTPVAVRDWAREEWLIADAFHGPVGRSTSGGLAALSQRLLADIGVRGMRPFPDGDDNAPPLPEILLTDPLRFMGETPPAAEGGTGDDAVDDLLVELEWYPDRAAFAWLCALAVYPSVTFDLALYLGRSLRERVGDDQSPPLFTPQRLAALTQLPWLRQGRIPDWLRRRLIAELPPARASEVRLLIIDLIKKAYASEDQVNPRHAQYGREDRKAGSPSGPLDDEVLIDFLIQGNDVDFEISPPKDPETLLTRLRNADWLRIGVAAVAIAYCIAAWWITPKGSDGPATTALWLPVAALAAAAALFAAWMRPAPVWWRARRAAHALGPAGLVLAMLAVGALLMRLLPVGWPATGGTAVQIATALGVFMLTPIADALSGRSDMRLVVIQARRWAGLAYLVRCAVTGAVAFALVRVADSGAGDAVPWLTALAVAGFALFRHGLRPAPVWSSLDEFGSRPQRDGRIEAIRNWAPLAGAVTVLAVLCVYAGSLRSAHTSLIPGQGYIPVMATSDGLIAATTDNGRTVRVWDAGNPGRVVDEFKLPDDVAGEVIRLAVVGPRDGRRHKTLVLAVLSDGRVLALRSGLATALRLIDGDLQGVPGSIRLAIAPNGTSLVAYQSIDGVNLAHFSNTAIAVRAEGFSFAARNAGGRTTEVHSINDSLFAFGTSSGLLGFLDRPNGPRVASSSSSPAFGQWVRGENLRDGPRLIRPLKVWRKGYAAFIAVGDDGRAFVVARSPRGGVAATEVNPGRGFPQLAMGPVVPWVDKPVDPVPPVPLKPGPTPVVAPSPAGLAPPPAQFVAGGCTLVNSAVVEPLANLLEAVRREIPSGAAGISATACYRSPEQIAAIKLPEPIKRAMGRGSHSRGTGIDFKITGCSLSDNCFATNPVGRWLAATLPRFGFRQSQVANEKWHWDYVGTGGAARAEIAPPPDKGGSAFPTAPACVILGPDCIAVPRILDAARSRTGQISQPQAAAIESLAWALSNEMRPRGFADGRIMAYLLATVEYETAGTFQPMSEKGGESYFERMYGSQTLAGKRLGNVRPGDGARFAGRGYTQLTGRANYRRIGELVGLPLENQPELLLREDVARKVLIATAFEGSLTGQKITDFLGDGKSDWVNARRVFNGVDRADLIAERARRYYAAFSDPRTQSAR